MSGQQSAGAFSKDKQDIIWTKDTETHELPALKYGGIILPQRKIPWQTRESNPELLDQQAKTFITEANIRKLNCLTI